MPEVADRYLESGHPEAAIFEAFKAINNRVHDGPYDQQKLTNVA